MRFLGAASVLGGDNGMAGGALAFVEDLNDRLGAADFDLLLYERVGHAVVAIVHRDMVVEVHPRLSPVADLVGASGQGL